MPTFETLASSVTRQYLNKHQQLFIYQNSRYFLSVVELDHLLCNSLWPFALIIIMMSH